jgi:hypothetical protein
LCCLVFLIKAVTKYFLALMRFFLNSRNIYEYF